MKVILALSILTYLSVFCLTASAQNMSHDNGITLSATAGTAFNDPASWFFYNRRTNDNDVVFTPGFSGTLAIGYGPFFSIKGLTVSCSFEAGFNNVRTSHTDVYVGTAQVELKRFPLLVWCKLTTQAPLSPFIRIGIGAMRVNFVERYSAASYENTQLDYWAFSLGAGAGIEYTTSDVLVLSLFVDSISGEGTHSERKSSGNVVGLFQRTIVIPFGLRVTLKL